MRTFAVLLALVASAACSEREQITYDAYQGAGYAPPPPLALSSGALVGFVADGYSDTVSVIDLASGALLREIHVGRDPVSFDGPKRVLVDGSSLVVTLTYPTEVNQTGPHVNHIALPRAGYLQRLSLPDLRVTGEARLEVEPRDVLRSNGSLFVAHFDLKRAAVEGATAEKRRADMAIVDEGALAKGSTGATFVPLCASPSAMIASGDHLIVACYSEDGLVVFDPKTRSVSSRVSLAGGAASGAQPIIGPIALGTVKSTGGIVVSSLVTRDVRFVDPATLAESAAPAALSSIGSPYSAASDARGRVYVPTQTRDAIVVLDATSHAVIATKELEGTCLHPHEAVLSDDESRLFVVCEGDRLARGTLLALDPLTLDVAFATPVGVYPDHLALYRTP